MSRPRTVLIAAVVALALGAGLARAQLVITDPAVTLRECRHRGVETAGARHVDPGGRPRVAHGDAAERVDESGRSTP